MDPLHLAISLGPLGVYLMLLGAVNFGSRPLITTGARDAAALGVGISGLVVAGPMELFFPETMAFHIGGFVWALLVSLYGLALTLFVLLMRPRLVIYNISREQLRPVLASLVPELDREARWAGDSLIMPRLGVQFYLESSPSMRVVQLVAAGSQQNYEGWRRLDSGLAGILRGSRGTRSSLGLTLAALGLLLLALSAFCIVRDPETVAQAFWEMLRL